METDAAVLILVAIALLSAPAAEMAVLPESLGFPFSVRGFNQFSPISAAFLNDHVAGSRGRVSVDVEGHLVLGEKRIKFFGLNCTTIPKKAEALELARRVAALGVNIVRLHHIDASWGRSLFDGLPAGSGTRNFNPAMLDDLDFFAAELFKNGVYIDLNLLTGRQFSAADGLPADIDAIANFKSQHALGFWRDDVRQLQEEYALVLLSHVNPYTGRSWKEETGVAAVEIINENGLLQAWMAGWLDVVPSGLMEDLRAAWMDHLKTEYGGDAGLEARLGLSSPDGPELLTPLSSASRPGRWNLEEHAGADAEVSASADGRSLRLTVKKTAAENWHVQFNHGGIILKPGTIYTLEFQARNTGETKMPLAVQIGMAHEPWALLGFNRELDIGPDWKSYRFTLGGLIADADARVNFTGIGLSLGAIELKELSFREGGRVLAGSGSLDDGGLALPAAADRALLPVGYLDEWLGFLYETEDRYWERMAAVLKDEIGVQSLLVGTIVGCSTPGLQSRFDIIDAHSYWNHPSFPGREWDGNDWFVGNSSMLRAGDAGVLGELAFLRVKGKPFSVSEFDYPWPNQYAFEMYPLLAAYAAYQDWDMIYGFTIDAENPAVDPYIAGYFDQLNHPLKAAALPFAARIFRQSLVPPAAAEHDLFWDAATERARLNELSGWNVFSWRLGGWEKGLALTGRVALIAAPATTPTNSESASATAVRAMAESMAVSGSDRFPWNATAGSLDLDYPNLSLRLRALASFAPLGSAAGLTANSAADLGILAAITETDPATGKARVVVFNARAAGNTNEALAEYSGPVTGQARQLKNPLSINRIRSTWKRGQRQAWALSNPWTIDYPDGFNWYAISPDGTAQPLMEAAARRMDPDDACLWYALLAE